MKNPGIQLWAEDKVHFQRHEYHNAYSGLLREDNQE